MQPDELKALRKAAGLSQAELADAIGMSRETVGQMERGQALIEKRTELAVRFVTSTSERPRRTPAAISNDVAELLDKVVVRGTAFDDQVRRLKSLEAEWHESGGLGVARGLFGITLGTLGMLRTATPGDPVQAPDQASLIQLKQQWRALAASGAKN